MAVGQTQSYFHKWRFKVIVPGLPIEAYFSKAGPLDMEIGKAEYKGGGAIIPHKEATMASFPPITLERGSTNDLLLYLWLTSTVNAVANAGLEQIGYKRTIIIAQLDRTGAPGKLYTLFDAFPVKYTAGDWDNNADEFAMNIIELEYALFEETPGALSPA